MEREVRKARKLMEEMDAAAEERQWAQLLALLGKADEGLEVSLPLLQSVAIGKAVKKLAKADDAACAAKAGAIVRKWKAQAQAAVSGTPPS